MDHVDVSRIGAGRPGENRHRVTKTFAKSGSFARTLGGWKEGDQENRETRDSRSELVPPLWTLVANEKDTNRAETPDEHFTHPGVEVRAHRPLDDHACAFGGRWNQRIAEVLAADERERECYGDPANGLPQRPEVNDIRVGRLREVPGNALDAF